MTNAQLNSLAVLTKAAPRRTLGRLLGQEQNILLTNALDADGGCRGLWEAWVKSTLDFTVEIVNRSDFNVRGYWLPAGQELTEEQINTFRGHRSFEVVKKRWIVERSIAWMTFQRRLNRNDELLPETTEAWVTLPFIRLMIRRLAAEPLLAAT